MKYCRELKIKPVKRIFNTAKKVMLQATKSYCERFSPLATLKSYNMLQQYFIDIHEVCTEDFVLTTSTWWAPVPDNRQPNVNENRKQLQWLFCPNWDMPQPYCGSIPDNVPSADVQRPPAFSRRTTVLLRRLELLWCSFMRKAKFNIIQHQMQEHEQQQACLLYVRYVRRRRRHTMKYLRIGVR